MPVDDWSTPICCYTAGPEIILPIKNELKLVCSTEDALLFELHKGINMGAKDPIYRFRASDIIRADVCLGMNQFHFELNCGEQMYHDIFIDLPPQPNGGFNNSVIFLARLVSQAGDDFSCKEVTV